MASTIVIRPFTPSTCQVLYQTQQRACHQLLAELSEYLCAHQMTTTAVGVSMQAVSECDAVRTALQELITKCERSAV